MTLRFLVGSRNFMRFFWGSWEFCTGKIVTTDLKNLVPQQRIHDDYVIHFLHWELCDLKLSSHQNFPAPSTTTTGASSARSPRYLRPRTDIAIWVIGSVCLHCAHPNPVRLLLAIHWKFMTWLGSVSISKLRVSPWLCRNTFIDHIFTEFL